MTTEINSANRIIAAVGKHVITEDALTCGNEGVGVDKSADCGVIITALQVIEAGILGRGLAKRSFLPCCPWFSKPENQGAFCAVVIGKLLSESQRGC